VKPRALPLILLDQNLTASLVEARIGSRLFVPPRPRRRLQPGWVASIADGQPSESPRSPRSRVFQRESPFFPKGRNRVEFRLNTNRRGTCGACASRPASASGHRRRAERVGALVRKP